MRLPLKGSDDFCGKINAIFDRLQESYLEAIKPAIELQNIGAMLGDGTVTQVNTFDPGKVQMFYRRLANLLKNKNWEPSDISGSKTEDLHRLYMQVAKEVGKYHITGYFGVQYHALPYYKVDKRVIEIQKELAKIADDASSVFKDMSGAANRALHAELEKRGYANLEFQELFTKMYDDENLVEDLDSKAAQVEGEFPEFEEMRKKKGALFGELNDLLIELYQTSPVSIDYNRLMQGEEGVTTYFDIEIIKNKKTKEREAYIDTGAVPKEWADKVLIELGQIADSLKVSS
ncbi:MAG: hypothetical protein MN733_10810 [Nitrososphaera sp.]|nr:hypothetical protein [Nitrososphaera sp.]